MTPDNKPKVTAQGFIVASLVLGGILYACNAVMDATRSPSQRAFDDCVSQLRQAGASTQSAQATCLRNK